jgi:hypothetical protein
MKMLFVIGSSENNYFLTIIFHTKVVQTTRFKHQINICPPRQIYGYVSSRQPEARKYDTASSPNDANYNSLTNTQTRITHFSKNMPKSQTLTMKWGFRWLLVSVDS